MSTASEIALANALADLGGDRMPLTQSTPVWLAQRIGPASAGAAIANYASAAWPFANLALYIPFTVTQPITIAKLWAYNGAAVASNIDVGIYSLAGARLVSSGSTAQAGTNTIQVFDVADTPLAVGDYFFGVVKNDAVGTLMFATPGLGGTTDVMKALGVHEQVTAFPLPATATFGTVGRIIVPLVGWTRESVF